MFIVARFFAGVGSWGFLAVIYFAELAPPGLRGLFVGMNGVNIALGYGLASYMGMAFYFAKDPVTQWRGLLGLALIWPLMMLITIFFVLESPRWLLMQGEVEKAREIVYKFHTIKGDPDQGFARGIIVEMFKRPSYRKRSLLAVGLAFIGQSTVVLVINNYGPTLYKALGYGTKDQLALQCGWITVGIAFDFVGATLMDCVGRRPLMLFGVSGCCVALILEAAMVATYAQAGANKAGLGVGVAAFYIFLAVYSIGIDVAGVVFYGELFPNHVRAKGLYLSMATIAITDLVYLQATVTAFLSIGWKFYLVFIIISGLGAISMFFVLPETKGIPLEERGKIFGDTEDVIVYAEDIHIDHNTHELVIQKHGGRDAGLTHVATEQGTTLEIKKDLATERIEHV
ncbi:MFS general substrate transporter [Glonium stellatum]|uniref:MFS general substrate transporter n=1 Tax=Glonium stellatum TaxID=574774 RepID=A0A8E2JQG2_9PEZI|nr:MFS general substrate transporter [Glonium stellatum]